MDYSQKDRIISALSQIDSLDIDSIAVEVYGDKDFDGIQINNYRLPILVDTIKKVTSRLKRECENDTWLHLPFTLNVPEVGNFDIASQVQTLVNNLSNKDLTTASVQVIWLVRYLMMHGLWKKSKVAELETELSNVETLYNKYELIEKKLEMNSNSIHSMVDGINLKKEELEEFKLNKEKELQQIGSLLNNAQQQHNQIGTLVTSSSTNDEKINGILKSQEQHLASMQKKIEEEEKRFREFSDSQIKLIDALNKKIEELTTQNTLYDQKLKFIESKEQYIIEKEREINELTGFAAGVSLFHTFDERKKQLKTSVRIWGLAVPVAAIVAIVWVWIVFSNNPVVINGVVDWSVAFANALKIIPLIVLLYFVIRQYRKERDFQEEYAFKSSVALTINAYADKLTKPENKERLIMESVEKVYQTPLVMKDRSWPVISFRSRALNDLMKNMNETMKEFKDFKNNSNGS